jgi:hypothetical protein
LRPTPLVHDTNLPVLAVFVGGDQTFDGLISGFAPGHKLEPARTVTVVRHRLRGHGADTGTSPGHDRSDGEELGLDGDAQTVRLRVEAYDGEGRDDPFPARIGDPRAFFSRTPRDPAATPERRGAAYRAERDRRGIVRSLGIRWSPSRSAEHA